MNIKVFTDNDLDGACSALLLKKLYSSANIDITEIVDRTFVGEAKAWFANNTKKYDKIYFTDLFIPDEIVELIDREDVVIIDHHQTQVEKKDRFKKAKVIIESYSSCALLIYDKFKKVLDSKTSSDVVKLVQIVDDYDNYTLKLPETLKLNAVFHFYNKPKVDKFIASFEDGIREFNVQELNSIKLYFNKLKDEINKTELYTGTIKGYTVIACFADFAINEVIHHVLKKTNADIGIVVIPSSKSVSFRKNKETCDIKLNKLAEILCGEGGGHEYAAGGKMSDKFLEFTKTLKPCTIQKI